MHTIGLYFDFISPYAWLALNRAETFAKEHRVTWELHPVVYARLLDASGLVGPAESPAKRRYTFHDISRCAEELGLVLEGPPAHPFRSIEALRAVCLLRNEPGSLQVCKTLADAAWSRGRDLSVVETIRDELEQAGVAFDDLEQQLTRPEIKQALFDSTAEAIRRGIFGVPTFAWKDELFWGHDRMEQLAARLRGDLAGGQSRAEAILARPRAVDRKR